MTTRLLQGPCNPLTELLHDVDTSAGVSVIICSAYVSRGGLAFTGRVLADHHIPSSMLTIVTGRDPFATDLLGLWEFARGGAQARVHAGPPGGLFHPKLFLVRTPASSHCFIGSFNATFRAFTTNIEIGVVLDPADQELMRQCSVFAEQMIAGSVPLTECAARDHERSRQSLVGAVSLESDGLGVPAGETIAEFLLDHPAYSPCLSSLGPNERSLDLALALDYLRSVAGVQLPVDMCLDIVRRCNLKRGIAGKIPADLHRLYYNYVESRGGQPPLLVAPLPADWPVRDEPPANLAGPRSFEWLFNSAKRSPLVHALRAKEKMEWAYTLDYLWAIGRVDIPWNAAVEVLRRSESSDMDALIQPDSLRGDFRKSQAYRRFKIEKGWARA